MVYDNLVITMSPRGRTQHRSATPFFSSSSLTCARLIRFTFSYSPAQIFIRQIPQPPPKQPQTNGPRPERSMAASTVSSGLQGKVSPVSLTVI